MMKVLLITAPRDGEVTEFISPNILSYDMLHYPPLGLLAIAAEVDPRHELKVLDTVTKNMTIQESINYIVEFKPDLLGMSIVSRRIYPSTALFRQIKELMPNLITVAGGPHVNDFSVETMRLGSIDYGLAGYCEKTFPKLVEALDQDKVSESDLKKIPNLYYFVEDDLRSTPPSTEPVILDDLPYPRRELVNLRDYYTAVDEEQMTTLYTSRGCPYKCSFCDVQEKNYYYRSTKGIVDEFEYILSLGIKEIAIFDDTFNMGRKRVVDMCEEILRRGLKVKWSARVRAHPFDTEMIKIMKEAGCVRLQCGVESLNPISLKNMKKKVTLEHIRNFFSMCDEMGIETLGYFILGFPEETHEYRQKFYQELKRLNPTYMELSILYPLAKTPYYEDLIKNGVYERDFWGEFFKNPVRDWNVPPYRQPELQAELNTMVDVLYKKFYLSPGFIIKELQRKTSFEMFMRKVQLAFKMMFIDWKKNPT